MYTLAKAVTLCAQLFLQQQESQDTFNRLAFYSSEPMYIVNASPAAMAAIRAQARYNRYCQ